MRVSDLRPDALARFVARQLANLLPDDHDAQPAVHAAMPMALERTRHCVAHVRAWRSRGFDPLTSGQYASLLYFLGREVAVALHDTATATRLFLLNKALNGLELFHEVELPDVFFLSHTPGLVLAKATYGDRLVLHQGCTVGRKSPQERPQFGERVVLFPGSMVIGHCRIGARTAIAPGVCLVDTDTPEDSLVLPGPGRPRIVAARREVWRDFFVD
jgi:serine O-acetyltransferase